MIGAVKALTAAATAAVLLSGCLSTVVPEAAPIESLLIGRLQGAVNAYCRKPAALRLAYRAIAAEATFPHVVNIECAKAPSANVPL